LPTADVARQGLDLYTAGDFAGAIPHLERAHEMEPSNFEVHYALAQALRQAGRCGDAVPHYKALVDSAPETQKAEVRANMELCPAAGITEQPATPPPPAPPPEPVIIREGISKTDIGLIAGAGAGIGAAIGLFIAASGDSGDADVARSYDDYERLSARSTTLYVASGIVAAAGIGLGVFAFLRIKSSKEQSSSLSLSPRTGGGTLVWEGSW
jgi:tetratricopeptide (TPR) repeat protein